jgi:uncharacterized protein
MRILGMTDIHGARKRVEDVLRKEPEISMLLLAGDLTTNGSAKDAHAAIDGFIALCPVAYAVAGNMDPLPVEQALAGRGLSLDARGVIQGDLGLFGLSGAPHSPMLTPNEYSEEELADRLEAGWAMVQHARWKVLVSHAPPLDTAVDRLADGRHVGSTAVREFCLRRQPDVVLCGHIHESRGTDRLGRTLLVNPGPGHDGAYCIMTVDPAVTVTLHRL